MFAILAAFFLLIDASTTGHVTWSLVVVLSVAFLVGAVMMLQFLATPDRTDRRPFVSGAALLIVAVLLLPVAVALQSAPTTTETYLVPTSPSVSAMHVVVSNDVGRIHVLFADGVPYAARADVTHIGGLFSSHFEGDLSVSNVTSGTTRTFTLATRGTSALFFFGGHDIAVTVNATLRASMALSSTTGSIVVDIPAGVTVAATSPGGGPSVSATVTTGSVTLASTDARYEAGARVLVTSSTGNLVLRIAQEPAYAGLVTVQAASTVGNVAFDFFPGPDVAARVAATTTAGQINAPGGKYAGTNAVLYAPSEEAYAAASMQFDVSLTTTTGNINLG